MSRSSCLSLRARLAACGVRVPTAIVAFVLLPACAAPEPGAPPQAGPCSRQEAPIPTPRLHTPRWAFLPWISKDISDTQDTYDFVEGFRSRDIPVGAVVLDSPWETNYNTFEPSPSRYPNFAKLVSDMHGRGVRVVLWVTPIINQSSFDLEPGGDRYDGPPPHFQFAHDCRFFINEGETFIWWKGQGAGIDFFNPAARSYWHHLQDRVLDQGIDGWKLDFGESYITNEPTNPVQTAAGEKTLQEYSEEYYRDFWAYGVQQRGPEFLTMVRAYDASYQFAGRFFARKEHAPVAWMGDNRRDFIGLADAMQHLFVSARAGYAVLGSDIGGYLDVDDVMPTGPQIPFDPDVFLRWTAVAALTPFMQLHGRANLAPWTVPVRTAETVAAYRFFAKLHEQLVPFFYSLSQTAQPRGEAILFPQGDERSWAGDFRFVVGNALLVAPILDASGVRDVALPAGSRWADFFALSTLYAGGTTVKDYDARSTQRLPLFLREGAIVPLEVRDNSTGLGESDSADGLSLLLFPGSQRTSFALTDHDEKSTDIVTQVNGRSVEIRVSRAPRKLFLLIRVDGKPASVTHNGSALASVASRAELAMQTTGHTFLADRSLLVVKLAPSGEDSVRIGVELP